MSRVWTIAAALLLSGCAAIAQTSTPSTSPTGSNDDLAAFHQLQRALDKSLNELNSRGTVSIYSDDSTAFFLEVYDPNSTYDYKGVGWMMETSQVELLLDLSMFSLYQLQSALDTAEPTEVKLLAENKIQFTPTAAEFSPEITVTLNPAGLVSSLDFPLSENPDSVAVDYGMDEFAESLIKKANDELIN